MTDLLNANLTDEQLQKVILLLDKQNRLLSSIANHLFFYTILITLGAVAAGAVILTTG